MNHPHDNWLDNFGQTLSDVLVERVENNVITGDVFDAREINIIRDELLAKMPPIDMVLHCPSCHLKHIDAPSNKCVHDACPRAECCGPGECQETWSNPPHRSHLCAGCGYVWRPSDVPTNGVKAVTTKGKNDTPPPEPLNSGDMLNSGGIWA